MRRFVVDNSVVMAWCFEDEAEGYADEVLDLLGEGEALVPVVWPLEVANVLLVGERRGRLGAADSARFLRLLSSLPIRVVSEDFERITGAILALARTRGLSSYDASYLDLAMREGLPLATLDEGMRRAATECAIPLV
ncbi:MAG: type II toxin-antitoxin system VapC family toxin [Polyangia bacterium]|nr:type II toxin-antitoxin system VapC family toxin [Polyangia bacterium]